MKQIVQDLRSGTTYIAEAPMPQISSNSVLIHTVLSLISIGTERMLVDFGKASYLEKSRQQPEKVKMVLNKIKTDGLFPTIEAVRSKLSQPLALGYCNVGIVAAVGGQVQGFKVGDRVISNGPHADIVAVPQNLCAVIPESVDNESASFTVLASIGLQGIRLAQPSLGEFFVVIGTGLIGLLTIQLLKAHGCRVLAIDFDEHKLKLAQQFGAEICNPAKGEDPIATGWIFSRGNGVDGVIITASTKSSDPVSQAATLCRKRGRIVLVGQTGLELNRSDFYEKELSFQVSCSYGPGRYDPEYEERGRDYPLAYVRWTEQRNFTAVLDMMDSKLLDLKSLISHKYAFESAPQAYQMLSKDHSVLGILLEYASNIEERAVKEVILKPNARFSAAKPILGVIGAGNYASRILLPAFKAAKAQLHTLVTAKGMNSLIHGDKNGFALASTDIDSMFAHEEMNTVAIVTRHNVHASLVVKALNNGKNVFVEKPLALNLDELSSIEAAYHTINLSGKRVHLMVGFNRRFAVQVQKMKELLEPIKEPKVFVITVNAGAIPQDHWTQDPLIGGGRIIGEACHFIDLLRFFIGCKITSIHARRIGEQGQINIKEDKAVITLGFEEGSFGSIHYLSNGSNSFPKERIEVFTAGRVLQLDNFRKLTGYGWPKFKKMNLLRQDKGQIACCKAFLKAIEQGEETPISIDEVIEVARVSIEIAQQLRNQQD